ncbi:hypothetical protein [Fimbriimonas ginsengisoli]|uniref:Uncharacterized protein n=1 Tax=Fimbriimonas ginsengisoli Gsoil 348 TaxID=661478 RepID=A0A068NU22_FIMGI|nr:hypothetical protein [Fimbriimonas ginsengisoli]AIE86867.1 hypothetical protein OP10G_3499 [Fimbriimonas ginsengisoli Gsoil 348]
MLPYLLYKTSGLNQLQFQQSQNTARAAVDDAVTPLEHRVEHLELACAGLWELLKNKLGCTEEELVAAIQSVDARDGVMDGRAGPENGVCPTCNRRLLTRRSPNCTWCGSRLQQNPFAG